MYKLSLKERLEDIVNLSYNLLVQKLSAGEFTIYNEASLQFQFGFILKEVGKMFEFFPDESLEVEMEKLIPNCGTCKSPKDAYCDIFIKMKNATEEAYVAIEVKYFLKDPNEAVTDNRFSVYMDLENLEKYMEKDKKIVACYELVYTNNENYTIVKNDDMSCLIGEGHVQQPGTIDYTQNRHLELKRSYAFNWRKAEQTDEQKSRRERHCFLLVKI